VSNPIKVIIYSDGRGVYLERPATSSLDRSVSIQLDVEEIDGLVADLRGVKVEMAKRKRYAAEQLLKEVAALEGDAQPERRKPV
jgi:hypothetical protein